MERRLVNYEVMIKEKRERIFLNSSIEIKEKNSDAS